jgi:hypothetical protein
MRKELPERRSGLRPSEKELSERRSGAFRHKNTPAKDLDIEVLNIK